MYYNTCYTSPFLNKSGSPLVCFHPEANGHMENKVAMVLFIGRHLKIGVYDATNIGKAKK